MDATWGIGCDSSGHFTPRRNGSNGFPKKRRRHPPRRGPSPAHKTLLLRSFPEIGPSGAPWTHRDACQTALSNAANLSKRSSFGTANAAAEVAVVGAALLMEIGVPVTVGIARTKTLAKLISDTAKPFGASALIDPDAVRALLDRLPVTEVSGIASRRAARLELYSIRTCLDLALPDRRLIRRLLTITGEALWYELNGDPVLPLYTERPPHKMLSRGGSMGEATADPDRVYAWLVRNLERLVEELEFHVVCAGALSLYILHKNGVEGFCRTELPSPIFSPHQLAAVHPEGHDAGFFGNLGAVAESNFFADVWSAEAESSRSDGPAAF